MKAFFNFVEKLIKNPTSSKLVALNKIMSIGIPFNVPHGFKILELSQEAVRISLPNRKLNHNHLGGIHACAIATVGEYCAGMSLISTFGIKKYRPILSDLSVKYLYQGRTDLEGNCSPTQFKQDEIEASIARDGKCFQTLETRVTDKNGKEVAIVTTTWQLKPWEQVKTK